MNNRILMNRIWIMALLLAAPLFGFAQGFERLYDVDSSYDWGYDVFVQQDSTYFVVGVAQSPITNLVALVNITLSKDGNTILHKQKLKMDNASIYPGNSGQVKRLGNGNYLVPIAIQRYVGAYLRSAAGLAKLDAQGDTVFLKNYTDTGQYFENSFTCELLPDGGYILGGSRSPKNYNDLSGLLIRTDSMGNMLWERTYKKVNGEDASINSLEAIGNNRILVGASNSHQVVVPTHLETYIKSSPWFMVLDSMGNIIKDTLYWKGYGGGGIIHKDSNGGYYHVGHVDTIEVYGLSAWENLPSYFAHLDTNFKMEYRTVLPYSRYFGHRYPWNVRQLSDRNFLIVGAFAGAPPHGLDYGWAAKLSRSGSIIWNQKFICYGSQDSYLTDMTERADGSLVFTGSAISDTTPTWHTSRDIWLVSVDSNGCLTSGCGPDTTDLTAVVPEVASPQGLSITLYPNPNNGNFTINTTMSGTLHVYDLAGRAIAHYGVSTGKKDLQLPAGTTPGIYVGMFTADNGARQVVKITYRQ